MINNKRRMKCDFCSNMFGDAKMLRQHQTRTQYCLKIQAKLEAEATEKVKESSCQYCGKYF